MTDVRHIIPMEDAFPFYYTGYINMYFSCNLANSSENYKGIVKSLDSGLGQLLSLHTESKVCLKASSTMVTLDEQFTQITFSIKYLQSRRRNNLFRNFLALISLLEKNNGEIYVNILVIC